MPISHNGPFSQQDRRCGLSIPCDRPREIGALVAQQAPAATFVERDNYNERARLRREEIGGRTPTGALIAAFDQLNVTYIVKWDEED